MARLVRVSVLFNEPKLLKFGIARNGVGVGDGFSALQRAEIAEIARRGLHPRTRARVSVLFNEPKLLKFYDCGLDRGAVWGFSALQRAEIAEIQNVCGNRLNELPFQCSSTSRNC